MSLWAVHFATGKQRCLGQWDFKADFIAKQGLLLNTVLMRTGSLAHLSTCYTRLEEVEQAVKNLMHPANKPQNIQAMLEAAKEYGRN